MDRIIRVVRSPGYKPAISETAATQLPFGTSQPLMTDSLATDSTADTNPKPEASAGQGVKGQLEAKSAILNRWLDAVVHFSGSQFVFFLIAAAVISWALLGIPFGTSVTWAVIISNVQAIICYIFDSLLMRQQLVGYEQDIRVAAMLQSRLVSHKRMVREAQAGQHVQPSRAEVKELVEAAQILTGIPAHTWLDRLSDTFAAFMGHMGTVAMFWVCIFIWLGFGPSLEWSDEWQLYINSSTSALMLLTFSFLANIRERHSKHNGDCLEALFKVDEDLEAQLRYITKDTTTNPTITIPGPKVSRGQRAIFYYADFVGTLAGVVIMMLVLAAWVAIGPSLEFNNNWWLLIGTYAGLMGMHDGFVLENMQTCLHSYVDEAMAQVHYDDMCVIEETGMLAGPVAEETKSEQKSWANRISQHVVAFASRPVIVLLNVLLIVGLLIGASLLKWTITGQLICNVPPSIIESFMMLIVITGHNLSDEKRRGDLRVLHERRLELLCWARALKVEEAK